MSEYKDVHCITLFYIGPRYSLFINFVCNGRVLSFGGNFVHMNKLKSQITECLRQSKGLRKKIRSQSVMWFKNELPGGASLAYTYTSYLVLSNNLTVLSFIGFFKV